MSNPRIDKRQRERAKREKAAAKAAAKAERRNATDDPNGADAGASPESNQETLLAELAALHARFEAKEIDLETLIAERELITERLQIL